MYHESRSEPVKRGRCPTRGWSGPLISAAAQPRAVRRSTWYALPVVWDNPLCSGVLVNRGRTCDNRYGEPDRLAEGPVSVLLLCERPERAGARPRRTCRQDGKALVVAVRQAYNYGFGATELNRVERLVREHEAELVKAWHDYFKPSRSGDR